MARNMTFSQPLPGKPLYWASEHEPHIVRLPLDRGANPNSVNADGDSEFFGITPLLMNVLMKDDCAVVLRKIFLAFGFSHRPVELAVMPRLRLRFAS